MLVYRHKKKAWELLVTHFSEGLDTLHQMIDNSPTPKYIDMERFVAIILGVLKLSRFLRRIISKTLLFLVCK